MIGKKSEKWAKECNAIQEHKYWTLSVDQWSSEFSAYPYVGPMDWGSAVLGWDWVSALRTQIVLMQAVLPTCFEKLRFIGLTEIWFLSDRRKTVTMTITAKISFLHGQQFRATSRFRLLSHTLPRPCDCFRTEMWNRSVCKTMQICAGHWSFDSSRSVENQ